MYRYIKHEDIEKLVQSDRQAWVIYGVYTKDKEEYINNITALLRNYGFNTDSLTQCSLCKNGDSYNIIITVRKGVELTAQDRAAMSNLIKEHGKIVDIREYVKNRHKIKYSHTESINCMVDTGKKKNNFVAVLRIITDENGDIKNAVVISPKFVGIHGSKIDTTNCERNIPGLVEKLYSMVYRKYRYTINRCSYKVGSKLLKYNVVPTQSGIKLNLVV